MVEHVARLCESPLEFVVRCSCGWESGAVSSAVRAHGRWSNHVRERRAAATMERAVRGIEGSRRRLAELAQVRERMRLRRETLAEQRRQLERDRMHVRSPAITQPHCTGRVLRVALAMSGKSELELWIAYLGNTGTLTLDELHEVLASGHPIGPFDHNLLAMTLNEWFDDAGFGHPVDLWDDAIRVGRRWEPTLA